MPINLSTPIHGSFMIGKWVKTKTNEAGKLEITVSLDSAGLCQIWLNHLPWVGRSNCIQFFAQPGDHIELSLEKDKEFESVQFTGDHAAENKLLNAFDRYTVDYWRQSNYLKALMRNKTASVLSDTLQMMEKEELRILDEYIAKHQLNSGFLSVLKEEIRYYHAHLFFVAWSVKSYNTEPSKSALEMNPWHEELEKLFKDTPINNPKALGSYRYNDYKNVTWPRYFDEVMVKVNESPSEKLDSVLYDQASQHLKGAVKEQHLAYMIKSRAQKNKFSESLQSLFFGFQLEFPKSPFLPDLAVEFSEVLEFEQQSNKSEMVFENQNFDDLNALINNYPNQRLYINIWASWCGPCKMDFKRQDAELETFFEKHNILKIYIAIDRDSEKEDCRKIIQFYDLKGDHYLASQALIESLKHELDGLRSFPIPRFLIVDANGQLVEKDAHRPIHGKKLIKQLSSYFDQ